MFHQVRLFLSPFALSWQGALNTQNGGIFLASAVMALSLSVGCSTGSEESEGAGISDEPMVEVILGDSERGASDGVGEAARFQGVTAMCALSNDRIALSDTFGGTIRMLDMRTSEVTTLSGSSEEPGVVDGALEDARFSGPRGIGCLPDGNSLIVADDGALRLVDLDANMVTTVAGRPGAPGNEDGSAVRARIGYLIHAIAVTPDGSKALLSDRSNDSIRAVDLQTYEVSTISTSSDGWSGPGGLAFDPAQTTSQTVWVADTFANRIRGLDIETGDIVELGASESPQGIVIHNGTALSIGFGNAITQTDLITGETSTLSAEFGGAFASPLVINNEMVYAELARESIRALRLDTLADRLVAGPVQSSGFVDGNGSDVRFGQITDMVASADGSWAIIADGGNSALRRAKFSADGMVVVDTVAVTGLEVPVGLALSNDGRLAIADYGAGTVVEVQIDTGGEVSEPRVLAEGLESPWGVAWGGNGEIFVAELDGARVSKIGTDGALSVYAGDTNGESSDPSTLSARFSAPVEVVPSDDGMLILDIGPGTIHWNDYREGTVSKLSGGRDVNEPEDGALDFASWGEPSRAVSLDGNTWLVADRYPGTIRLLRRDATGGRVSTVVGSPRRSGGLPAGAKVPLSKAAIGSAAALAIVEGAWLVATDTAILRIDDNVLSTR